MLRTMRRFIGQLLLVIGLLAGSTLPAQAATPTGGVNPCVVLAVCVVIETPGSSGSPGSGGSGGGSGGGQDCTWNNVQRDCYNSAWGWFSNETGCYYSLMNPQPDAGDPLWEGNPAGTGGVYLLGCLDTANNITGRTKWLAKPPNIGVVPAPEVVAQMAIAKLQFVRPIPRTAPPDTGLVGVKSWFWYDTTPQTHDQTVGPQTQVASINGASVSATATLKNVVWDLGYKDPSTGQEVVVHCADKGAGLPYTTGLEKVVPVPHDACTGDFSKASATAADGKFYLTVTQYWEITTLDLINGGAPWPTVYLSVASLPLGLQVNELQVLN